MEESVKKVEKSQNAYPDHNNIDYAVVCENCDVNAECLEGSCMCKEGYTGDGKHCGKYLYVYVISIYNAVFQHICAVPSSSSDFQLSTGAIVGIILGFIGVIGK